MLKISKEHVLCENSKNYFRLYHSCTIFHVWKKNRWMFAKEVIIKWRWKRHSYSQKWTTERQLGNISNVKHCFFPVSDDSLFLHEGKGELTFTVWFLGPLVSSGWVTANSLPLTGGRHQPPRSEADSQTSSLSHKGSLTPSRTEQAAAHMVRSGGAASGERSPQAPALLPPTESFLSDRTVVSDLCF